MVNQWSRFVLAKINRGVLEVCMTSPVDPSILHFDSPMTSVSPKQSRGYEQTLYQIL